MSLFPFPPQDLKGRILWEVACAGGAAVLAGIGPAWRKYQHHRIASWPTTQGKITATRVSQQKLFGLVLKSTDQGFVSEIDYTYSAEGQTYVGTFRKKFQRELEAFDYTDGLLNSPIVVSYKAAAPSKSALTEEEVVKARAFGTIPAEVFEQAGTGEYVISPKLHGLVAAVIVLAAIGLGASLYVHVNALMGKKVLQVQFFAVLHVGIFIVWFPAVLMAQKLVRYGTGKDWWKTALRYCPWWLKTLVLAIFYYSAFSSFLIWTSDPGSGSPNSIPTDRGFSATWMVFYGAATAISYSALRARLPFALCRNGHTGSFETKFCAQCGERMHRPPLDTKAT